MPEPQRSYRFQQRKKPKIQGPGRRPGPGPRRGGAGGAGPRRQLLGPPVPRGRLRSLSSLTCQEGRRGMRAVEGAQRGSMEETRVMTPGSGFEGRGAHPRAGSRGGGEGGGGIETGAGKAGMQGSGCARGPDSTGAGKWKVCKPGKPVPPPRCVESPPWAPGTLGEPRPIRSLNSEPPRDKSCPQSPQDCEQSQNGPRGRTSRKCLISRKGCIQQVEPGPQRRRAPQPQPLPCAPQVRCDLCARGERARGAGAFTHRDGPLSWRGAALPSEHQCVRAGHPGSREQDGATSQGSRVHRAARRRHEGSHQQLSEVKVVGC